MRHNGALTLNGVKYYRPDDHFERHDLLYFTGEAVRSEITDLAAWDTTIVYGELYLKGAFIEVDDGTLLFAPFRAA